MGFGDRFKKIFGQGKKEDEKTVQETESSDENVLKDSKIELSPIGNVLFVCSGNIDRSPMAEAIFNQKVTGLKAFSAGLFAQNGGEASHNAVTTCANHGIDLSGHITRNVHDFPVEDMDLILALTVPIRDGLKSEYPDSRIFTLKEHAGDYSELDIADPFGGDLSEYEECFAEIDDAISRIFDVDLSGDIDSAEGLADSHKHDDLSDEPTAFKDSESIEKPSPIRDFKYLEDLIGSGEKEIVLDCDIKLADHEYNNMGYDYSERYKFEAANRGIFINSDIIIDGQGHSIDASGLKRIFYIMMGNVTFKNIIFRNGSTLKLQKAPNEKDGGAIYNKGNLTLINCILEKNTSVSNGGAIYNNEKAILNVVSCKFRNNTAINSSAIDNYGKLRLNDCTFQNNVSLECCVISTNNPPQLIGGSIIKKFFGGYEDAFLDCHGCRFINNKSNGKSLVIENGSYTRIINSEFISDASNQEGSVIHQNGHGSHNDAHGETHTLHVMSSLFSYDSRIVNVDKGFCTLENLKIDSSSPDYLIYNVGGSVAINRVKFNSSNEHWIYNGNVLKINKRDNLEGFVASSEGSIIKYYDNSIPSDWNGFEHLDNLIRDCNGELVLDCDIVMHEVEQSFYEGGIDLNRDDLVIDGNGHSIDAAQFSRIFNVTGKNITLKNITFKNGFYFKNYLDSVDNGGGVINIIHGASLNICGCKFINNASQNSAGVLFNKGSLKVYKSEFNDNFAQRYGGVFNNKSHLTISGCIFENNKVYWEGDVFANQDCLEISDSEFVNNRADGDYNASGGGVIKNMRGTVKVRDSVFEKNSTGDEGGVLNNWGGSAHMTGCRLADNSAANGDVIYSQDYFVYGGSYMFEDCILIDNDLTFDKDVEDW